jgi:hypothetical protein
VHSKQIFICKKNFRIFNFQVGLFELKFTFSEMKKYFELVYQSEQIYPTHWSCHLSSHLFLKIVSSLCDSLAVARVGIFC